MFQYNKYTSHQPAKIEPGKRTRIVDGQPSDTIDAPGKARHLSSDPGVVIQQLSAGYAQYNDVPVPLDSDGDGRAVPGDYDGDGRTDTAVWRPSTSVCWVLRTSDGAVVSQRWGLSTDMAISRALQ
jgi:hypothetical protein